MTDQQSTEPDETLDIRITLYPEDGEEKGIRQIGLGLKPFILLEVSAGEDDDDIALEFTGSIIDDNVELLETLEGFANALRAVLVQEGQIEVTGDDADITEGEA